MGKKGEKTFSKIIDIIMYALKMGVTHVLVLEAIIMQLNWLVSCVS